jgi:putative aminopeptidase FrvX
MRLILSILFLILSILSNVSAQTPADHVKSIQDDPRVKAAFDSIDKDRDAILHEWIAITEINAPSKQEQERAKYIESLLRKHKLEIRYDTAGNLIATRKGTGGGPVTVFDAHLDTVFQPGLKIKATVRDGRVYAPGIGDDTRNVEAMLAMIRALDAAGIKTKGDLVFLFTVEEETTFKGVNQFVRDNKDKIGHYIALDGGYEGFTYGGIGTAPSLMQPRTTSYQSGTRGSITNTRSPLATPWAARNRAARSEEAARSAKLNRRASPSSGPTASRASLSGSVAAQASTTSRA